MKLGDINVNILQCLYQAVEEQGKNPDPLFAEFGLGDLKNSHPERRISIPRYMRLGEKASRLTERDDIGILMGEKCRSLDTCCLTRLSGARRLRRETGSGFC